MVVGDDVAAAVDHHARAQSAVVTDGFADFAFRCAAGELRFKHAEIQTDHHQRLPGLIVELAAYAFALVFLRCQQVSGEFGDSGFASAQFLGHLGSLDGHHGAIADRPHEIAFVGQPLIWPRKAEDHSSDDILSRFEGHSPERLCAFFDSVVKYSGIAGDVKDHVRLAG